MSRVNFTYEMAAKIAELVDEHTCGDWPPEGYESTDTPEERRRLAQHEKTVDRLEKWAISQMAKRLAKGYKPKKEQA